MSYVTLEVEIEHGKIVPKEPGNLPDFGNGLLTILSSNPPEGTQLSPLQAFRLLQREVQLTLAQAEALCGPLPPHAEQAARQTVPLVEPLLAVDAEKASKLFNQTGRRSRTFQDCMIAAVAIRCGAPLATLNSTDFAHFVSQGLALA